jgi:hypothetical protein
MVMKVNSVAVYDALINLLDTIAQEPDPMNRLALFQYLGQQYQKRVLPARDAAAYDTRNKYAIRDIEAATGCEARQIYYWTGRHQSATGAPPIGRRERQDVSDAIELHSTLMRRRKMPETPSPSSPS